MQLHQLPIANGLVQHTARGSMEVHAAQTQQIKRSKASAPQE